MLVKTMKKALIYDLDHTLFNPNTLDRAIFQPAFEVFNKVAPISGNRVTELERDFFSISLNAFIDKHLPGESKEEFIQSLRNITLPKLETYKDSYLVPQLGTVNYLVTSGLREFQHQKIEALGIKDWFNQIYVDDPIDPTWKDKEEIMRLIMRQGNYQPSDLLVVGDNPLSEIKAGNALGIETVQILRLGIQPSEIATYQINNLEELRSYL
jgi:FMN phosphatase YigB (HAD superfamily)